MKRRKGYLALVLLLMLSAAAAIAGGLVMMTARTAAAPLAYGNGLRAVYAAESGAVWAMESLRSGEISSQTISFTGGGTETTVAITAEEEGGVTTGTILSTGTDTATGTKRYVKISFSASGDEDRKLVAESVGTSR